MTSGVAAADVIERARGLRAVVSAEAGPSELLRTMSATVVDALWSSGLMTAFNPREAGGHEPGFAEMIDTWIEMAWQDGSFGWIGIANFPSAFAAACYLPQAGFAEVFTANDNHVTLGGQFAPLGQGVQVDGGYRLSGSWSFGSGTAHSQYVAAGTTSIREGSRLERAFRDIYTGTQHAFISEKVAMDAAQVWLGLVPDQFAL